MKRFICLLFFLVPQLTFAWTWSDLWWRPDQQAASALKQGEAKLAANQFTNKQWKGVANYRAKDYQHAAQLFADKKTPEAYYNYGNSLAHLGKYQEAIDAYNKAIKKQPNFKDAIYNQDLLKKLQKQQKQKNKQSKNNKPNKNKKNKEQQKQNQQQKDQKQNKQNQSSSGSKPKQKKQKNQQQSQQQKKESLKNTQQNKSQPNKKLQLKPSQQKQQTPEQQEKQQQLQQWLRNVPDDPGGLLRRKFLRDHLRRKAQQSGSYLK